MKRKPKMKCEFCGGTCFVPDGDCILTFHHVELHKYEIKRDGKIIGEISPTDPGGVLTFFPFGDGLTVHDLEAIRDCVADHLWSFADEVRCELPSRLYGGRA